MNNYIPPTATGTTIVEDGPRLTGSLVRAQLLQNVAGGIGLALVVVSVRVAWVVVSDGMGEWDWLIVAVCVGASVGGAMTAVRAWIDEAMIVYDNMRLNDENDRLVAEYNVLVERLREAERSAAETDLASVVARQNAARVDVRPVPQTGGRWDDAASLIGYRYRSQTDKALSRDNCKDAIFERNGARWDAAINLLRIAGIVRERGTKQGWELVDPAITEAQARARLNDLWQRTEGRTSSSEA